MRLDHHTQSCLRSFTSYCICFCRRLTAKMSSLQLHVSNLHYLSPRVQAKAPGFTWETHVWRDNLLFRALDLEFNVRHNTRQKHSTICPRGQVPGQKVSYIAAGRRSMICNTNYLHLYGLYLTVGDWDYREC